MKQPSDMGNNKDEAKDLIDTAEELINLVERYINKNSKK